MAAQKIRSIVRHLRDDSPRALSGLALTRLGELVFRYYACPIRALWTRILNMELGRRSRIYPSAAITGHARISAGDDLFLGRRCHLKSMADCLGDGRRNLRIGHRVFINEGTILDANYSISIGDDTMLGPYCLVIDSNHDFGSDTLPIRDQGCTYEPVSIGKGCWIGAHVVILAGVTIGDHSVVAANSTVCRDVPPDCVAAGTPAREIRRLRPSDRLRVARNA
jgi:acetyltransferase-like isoleucine patch superfamily enzyme